MTFQIARDLLEKVLNRFSTQ